MHLTFKISTSGTTSNNAFLALTVKYASVTNWMKKDNEIKI